MKKSRKMAATALTLSAACLLTLAACSETAYSDESTEITQSVEHVFDGTDAEYVVYINGVEGTSSDESAVDGTYEYDLLVSIESDCALTVAFSYADGSDAYTFEMEPGKVSFTFDADTGERPVSVTLVCAAESGTVTVTQIYSSVS